MRDVQGTGKNRNGWFWSFAFTGSRTRREERAALVERAGWAYEKECAKEGYTLKGCMWLADLKFDWEGHLVSLPVPVKAGSRYGIYHCCCNYLELSPEDNASQRKAWNRFRTSFRKDWSGRFGQWPEQDGIAWPGHHIRDLWHGGDPVDPNNGFPAQPDVHDVYNEQYPACYSGKSPWNTVGPNLPYTDNG
jgi:hypothetical protein